MTFFQSDIFKGKNGSYLLLEAYVPMRMLRSSTQLLLLEPKSLFVHLDYGIVFL